MIKLTLTYAMATEYNEVTKEWSGREFSLYSEPLTKTSTTLEKALIGFMDNYYWGTGIVIDYNALMDELKYNAVGNTSSISYTGDEEGNYEGGTNEEGADYLIELSFKVETLEPADIATLLTD